MPVKRLTRQLRNFMEHEFYSWQKTIYDYVQVEDDRWIHLVYDQVGNVGKSIFLEFLEYQGLAFEMPPLRQIAAKLQKTAKRTYVKRKPIKRAARPMVNKNAIDILARKVARLSRATHGSVQVIRQRAEVNGEVWGHTKPMAICMENIYTGSRVYSGYWNPSTNLPMVFHDATFDKYSLRNTGTGTCNLACIQCELCSTCTEHTHQTYQQVA